ncbi:MAG: dipicolinate synthase subunit B [Ruminococcaceae bacterium]|nr:dipicolinate synthase subunit B [Oscillospiraceae bacterium]
MKNKTLGFALTGSFCTFSRVVKELEVLASTGASVMPIMSQNAYTTDTRFGKAQDFIQTIESITGNKIIHTIAEAEPIGPKNLLDALVIAPCTGNTLAKLANGITDTAVTMAAKATLRNQKPVIIAVSTNDGLGGSGKNIGQLLNTQNYYFVPYEQDDPIHKTNSLVADMSKITETIELALKNTQIQPILLG